MILIKKGNNFELVLMDLSLLIVPYIVCPVQKIFITRRRLQEVYGCFCSLLIINPLPAKPQTLTPQAGPPTE